MATMPAPDAQTAAGCAALARRKWPLQLLLTAIWMFAFLTLTAADAGPFQSQLETVPDGEISAPAPHGEPERFQWAPALKQSLLFLGVQHASRMAQEKTRRELDGPFLHDWLDAAGNLQWKWSDEDGILTNYVGHPMIGAVAGYVQVFNDPAGRHLVFNPSSKDYWKSRLKALAWSAAYSTQFELGPLGEAALGNTGRIAPTMAMVDLVMTPAGGFGLMLLEDYLDKRFITRWEERTANVTLKRFYRLFFNPNRALANLLRFRRPSYREDRPIGP